jgi:hypothetical protein
MKRISIVIYSILLLMLFGSCNNAIDNKKINLTSLFTDKATEEKFSKLETLDNVNVVNGFKKLKFDTELKSLDVDKWKVEKYYKQNATKVWTSFWADSIDSYVGDSKIEVVELIFLSDKLKSIKISFERDPQNLGEDKLYNKLVTAFGLPNADEKFNITNVEDFIPIQTGQWKTDKIKVNYCHAFLNFSFLSKNAPGNYSIDLEYYLLSSKDELKAVAVAIKNSEKYQEQKDNSAKKKKEINDL